jgi:murein DD-endopeptidase MepM/ murein hydrolase activator NlpD
LAGNNHVREAQYIKKTTSELSDKKKDQKHHAKMIQRIVSSLVVLFCVGFLIMGGANLVSANSHAYVLLVDGQEIATLVSESEADQALDICLKNFNESSAFTGSDLKLSYDNSISFKQISATGVVYSSVGETAEKLAGVLNLVADATAIRINGENALYVADDQQAIEAVNAAKNYYGDPKADPTVTRVYTSEEISISNAQVGLSEVMSQEEATAMLLFGSTKVKADAKPLITVNVERDRTEREILPYGVVKQENSSLSRGEENVISEGTDGIHDVTYKLTEVNGVMTSSEPLESNVIVAAVDQVIEVGTQYYIASRSDGGGSGILGWPADGMITSRFGWRSRGWHSGIDVAAPVGTTIFAADPGTVICADEESGYGLVIRVDHGDGLVTVYAHCAEFFVEVGDAVDRNTAIAAIGMTGTTTGPHVHFEVLVDGQAVNPLDYLEEE